MRRWLLVSHYHWSVLLVLLGLSATVVAWISFGLINLAMANFDFVTRHGVLALREGGLVQMLQIAGKGSLALGAYLLFKAVETELIYRWRGAGK